MIINIAHLYPDIMNLYGDKGNILALKKRCEWRGVIANVMPFTIGSEFDLRDADIIFIGGGSDRAQSIMYEHFLAYKDILKEKIENSTPVLAICGGYQLLGKYYVDAHGNKIKGLHIFDYYTDTDRGSKRLIGNIVVKNTLGLEPITVVGLENHGGRTYHSYQPFGKVLKGWGNNGKDSSEGIVYKNCIGTYLHGPLLPKNPHIADYLILKALQKKYSIKVLQPLDNGVELKAHNEVFALYF